MHKRIRCSTWGVQLRTNIHRRLVIRDDIEIAFWVGAASAEAFLHPVWAPDWRLIRLSRQSWLGKLIFIGR